MFLIIFLFLIVLLILQISILSTCSDINDNILDLERSLRSIPKFISRLQKGKK